MKNRRGIMPSILATKLRFAFLIILIAAVANADVRHRAVGKRCGALPPMPLSTPYVLRYDQLGYLAGGERWAVILSDGQPPPSYRIFDVATNCAVAEGLAGPRVLDTTSRARTRLTGDLIEFTSLQRGRYVVVLADGSQFGPITIGDDVYADVIPASMQFFRTQRCGVTCHLFSSVVDGNPLTFSGDGVAVDYGSREHVTEDSGPRVDVQGGWHDAGDLVKIVSTTAYTLTLHLITLRDHPDLFPNEEMRWGLDWLLKMIDRSDPFLQVGNDGDHDAGFRLPQTDTTTPIPAYDQRPAVRFISGAGRNLLAKSAAAFALGAHVYSDHGLLDAARRAYQAALDRPANQASDPPGFYAEPETDDDLVLAAAILYQETKEPVYRDDAFRYAPRLYDFDPGIAWSSVAALALSETAACFAEGSSERRDLRDHLVALVAPLASSYRSPAGPGSAFRYALPEFGDGSVAESLGAAAACLAANRIAPDPDYLEVARTQLHWLFGANPFGLSFMIGVGQRFPQHPHHAIAALTGATLTGAIVGGPSRVSIIEGNPSRSDDYARWSTDDLVYEDVTEDYVVNEPAIDFPAALIYVLGELTGHP